MAENKRSFLLYTDLIFVAEKLSDNQAGILLKTILRYVNDQNPTVEDPFVDLAFEPIKQALKRDLKKYENILEKRSAAGKKSAEIRVNKSQHMLTNDKSVKQVEHMSTVNDNVSDNVSEINNKGLKSSKLDKSIVVAFVEFFNSVKGRNFRKNKKIEMALNARLKEYTKEEIKKSVINAHNDVYHIETKYKYLTPDFILRPDKLDKFLNAPEQQSNLPKGYTPQLTN